MFRHWFAPGLEGRAPDTGIICWGEGVFRALGLILGTAFISGALLALPAPALAQSAGSDTATGEEYDFRLSEPLPDAPLEGAPAEDPSAEELPAEDTPAEDTPSANLPVEPETADGPADTAPAVGSSEPQISSDNIEPGFDFKLSQMPPLPPGGPVAGPPVDPNASDDVDRRTTAFTPNNLSMLTEIELPDVDEDERWIRVDLSEQMVIAYEGLEPVRGFIVSTGLPGTPTVTGVFRIRTKVRSQTMTGGSLALGTYYSLPNVEWVQYFYADYGFHGTYWHNNFGQPMSHGCINMTNADAKWLFDWAGPEWDGETIWFAATTGNPGTLVIVHE